MLFLLQRWLTERAHLYRPMSIWQDWCLHNNCDPSSWQTSLCHIHYIPPCNENVAKVTRRNSPPLKLSGPRDYWSWRSSMMHQSHNELAKETESLNPLQLNVLFPCPEHGFVCLWVGRLLTLSSYTADYKVIDGQTRVCHSPEIILFSLSSLLCRIWLP